MHSKAIMIADDHEIVRVGIKSLINEHLHVKSVDEAGTQMEVVQLVKNGNYDLILLDINMPGDDFKSLMDWLHVNAPATAILVFSMHPEEVYGKRCMQMGARGFLHKTAPNSEILSAVTQVLSGKKYMSEQLKDLLTQTKEESMQTNPFSKLSARELEIAVLLNKEMPLPKICATLNIQYSTANTYKRRIFEKLNVNNTISLTRLMETYKMES